MEKTECWSYCIVQLRYNTFRVEADHWENNTWELLPISPKIEGIPKKRQEVS